MLSNLLQELRSTTKPTEKQQILLTYDSWFLRHLIRMTYDPFEMFHIKLKKKEIPEPGIADIEHVVNQVTSFLQFCLESKSPKQNREAAIPLLAQLNTGSQELLLGILNKNWKVGLGVKSILKVYPKLVPLFLVQLANKYHDYIAKKGYTPQQWLRTYKLDGVRCIALREWELDNPWTFISRQGHPFKTVDHLSAQLEEVYNRTGMTMWDGELYKHGLEFEEVQSLVTGFTRGPALDIELHAFIGGDAANFFQQEPDGMVIATPNMFEGLDKVTAVDCKLIDEDDVYTELEEAFELGYEGIMLRSPDKLYEFKRSDSLIKLKKDKSDNSQEEKSDCLVVDAVFKDDFPVIVDGELIYKRYITKLWVEQKDETLCKVGSGYSLKFREAYTDSPESIIGKVIEVEHQGYGRQGRMRFPRFKRIREDLVWGA